MKRTPLRLSLVTVLSLSVACASGGSAPSDAGGGGAAPGAGGGAGDGASGSPAGGAATTGGSGGAGLSQSGGFSGFPMGASGTGGKGGGTGAPELCFNGVDDDGNGATDCQDAACASTAHCATSPTAGWEAYLLVRTGTYVAGSPATPCAGGVAPKRLLGSTSGTNELADEPGQCGTCACGGAATVTCDLPSLLCAFASGCGGALVNWTDTYKLPGAGCTESPMLGATPQNPFYCTVEDRVKAGTSCPATGGAVLPKVPWTLQHDVCPMPPTGAGCTAGSTCEPIAAADQFVCMRLDGAHACPAGWSIRYVTYQGGDDARACSACGCTVPKDACTGGQWNFHDPPMCQGDVSNTAYLTQFAGCTNLTGINDSDGSIMLAKPSMAIKGCDAAPGGGQASGALHKQGQATLCCK